MALLYWSIVDLQCCAIFFCTADESVIYTNSHSSGGTSSMKLAEILKSPPFFMPPQHIIHISFE